MRFLIIDDDAAYRKTLRYYLSINWPDASIHELDPRESSERPAELELELYDTVLLAYPIGNERGFDWLRELCRQTRCPPVIVFAATGNEFVAVDALKAGAASYFPKSKVRYKRFVETIRSELGFGATTSTGVHLIQQSGLRRGRQYRYIETLHSGQISSIYVAKNMEDDALVAFKVLQHVPDSGNEYLFDRFLQEYELIAAIDHPNVVKIYDLGVADDHAYIAMEYLPAGNLTSRIAEPLPPPVALDIASQIAAALTAIHGAGILHRDLKPSNVMFRDQRNIVLIDFGLAKQMELEAALTGNGQIFGTPHYMSPEQGHGQLLDERSDIYSLGCLFFEMLMGWRPFVASSAMGIIYKHAHDPRPELRPELAPYAAVLDRMFAADPEARFGSAEELLEALACLRADVRVVS
jgi:eukaryotic-like serine/threonine-protein kinase